MPKTLEPAQISQKPTETALDSLWHAYLRTIAESPNSPLKTPPTPQKSAHGSVYFPPSTMENSGEGVAQSAELVQTLDYYPFGGTRIDNQYGNFDEKRKFTGHEYDSSTGLSYMGARYQTGTQGRFISQDSASRDNPVQFIEDPQQLNSYSYSRNNPIVNIDPTGNATYYFANGAGMSGIDTWNRGTYYETNDRTMLRANAARMESARPSQTLSGLTTFTNLVRERGQWDYKSGNRAYYFFDGGLVDKETFGNIHYGYVGTAGGFGPDILKDAGGFVQVLQGTAQSKWSSTNYDDPRDTQNIQTGISSYQHSSLSPQSVSRAQSTNASYTSSPAQMIARGSTSALNASYQSLSQAISLLSSALSALSSKLSQ